MVVSSKDTGTISSTLRTFSQLHPYRLRLGDDIVHDGLLHASLLTRTGSSKVRGKRPSYPY